MLKFMEVTSQDKLCNDYDIELLQSKVTKSKIVQAYSTEHSQAYDNSFMLVTKSFTISSNSNWIAKCNQNCYAYFEDLEDLQVYYDLIV